MTNRSLIHNKTTKMSIQMTKTKCYNEFHGKIYFLSNRQVFKLKTENQLPRCSTNKNNQNKRKMTYQNPCKRYLIISSLIWSLENSKKLENNFEKNGLSIFNSAEYIAFDYRLTCVPVFVIKIMANSTGTKYQSYR